MKKTALAIFRAARGLIAERKHGEWELSKGHIAFWIVFFHCIHIWSAGPGSSASEGELDTLWALLGYSTFKMGADLFAAGRKAVSQPQPPQPPAPAPAQPAAPQATGSDNG